MFREESIMPTELPKFVTLTSHCSGQLVIVINFNFIDFFLNIKVGSDVSISYESPIFLKLL